MTHWSRVRGLAASAGVWLRALNQRSVLHQRTLAHDDFLLVDTAVLKSIHLAMGGHYCTVLPSAHC